MRGVSVLKSSVGFRSLPGWSPAFLGQVRLAGSRPSIYLGQEEGAPKDISRVVSSEEFANMSWTKDQAIETFGLANLVQGIMEKLAFSRSVFSKIQSDPAALAAMIKAGAGPALSQTLAMLNGLLEKATLPNAIATTRNLQNALEVNILPKWGVGVKGTRPLFKTIPPYGLGVLVSVSTDTTAGKTEVINFGDLTKTDVETDMAALKAATTKVQDIVPKIRLSGARLGEPITLTVAIVYGVIALSAVIVTWMVTSTIKSGQEAAKPPVTDPDTMKRLTELCNSLPEQLRAQCWGNIINNNGFWNGTGWPKDIWLYVGVGVVGLLGLWAVSSFVRAIKE